MPVAMAAVSADAGVPADGGTAAAPPPATCSTATPTTIELALLAGDAALLAETDAAAGLPPAVAKLLAGDYAAVIAEGADAGADADHTSSDLDRLDRLCRGAACLRLFLQLNFTGPPLAAADLEALALPAPTDPATAADRASLARDGEVCRQAAQRTWTWTCAGSCMVAFARFTSLRPRFLLGFSPRNRMSWCAAPPC